MRTGAGPPAARRAAGVLALSPVRRCRDAGAPMTLQTAVAASLPRRLPRACRVGVQRVPHARGPGRPDRHGTGMRSRPGTGRTAGQRRGRRGTFHPACGHRARALVRFALPCAARLHPASRRPFCGYAGIRRSCLVRRLPWSGPVRRPNTPGRSRAGSGPNWRRHGVVVASGLARGVDSSAHQGCLDAGGPTVAVLGSGVDRIYPAEHAALAASICERGTLVSELAPGAPPLPEHFPLRNRIISGISLAVVVVEASATGAVRSLPHDTRWSRDEM